MFQRYPPDHEEYQELDYPQEPEDIAEAEHLSLISYRMSKSEAPDENVEDFDPHSIYLGKSSGRQLLVQAIEAKEQVFPTSGRQSTRASRACSVSGGAESEPGDEQTPFENLTLEERSKEWSDFHNCFLGRRRPEFWKILPVRRYFPIVSLANISHSGRRRLFICTPSIQTPSLATIGFLHQI